jgi:hypothetical protein
MLSRSSSSGVVPTQDAGKRTATDIPKEGTTMVHLIAYDLHDPGRDYDPVTALIRTASGGCCHMQGSVWLVDTLQPPAWWRDQLKRRGDPNDEHFVTRLRHSWAGLNVGSAAEWLKHPGRRW